MRIISVKTLKNYWESHFDSFEPLKAWYQEVGKSEWSNPNELKEKYGNASIISSKRVVFNIKGNEVI